MIRYYTNEGLLPQPDYEGKYAYYNKNHLQSLVLIRLLKDTYLPLREIRQIMLSIKSEEELQKMIDQYLADQNIKKPDLTPKQYPKKGSEALDYIKRLKEKQEIYRDRENVNSYQFLQPLKDNKPQPDSSVSLDSSIDQSETWQRILIVPGVELFLRQPADHDVSTRIQELIAFAKKLFHQI